MEEPGVWICGTCQHSTVIVAGRPVNKSPGVEQGMGPSPMAAWERCVAGCGGQLWHPPTRRKNTRQPWGQHYLFHSKDRCAFLSSLWSLQRVLKEVWVWSCTWPQLKHSEVTCGPARSSRAMPRALMHGPVWEAPLLEPEPRCIHFHSGILLSEHMSSSEMREKL